MASKARNSHYLALEVLRQPSSQHHAPFPNTGTRRLLDQDGVDQHWQSTQHSFCSLGLIINDIK